MNGEPTVQDAALTTRIKSHAQLLLCKGCCCGRTDRGLPEVPVDRIKAIWKSEKLNRGVQLTISGCLGPCDLPNVAVVVTSAGTQWFGKLDGDAHYDALINWARASTAEGIVAPLPEVIEGHRFERFAGPGMVQDAGESGIRTSPLGTDDSVGVRALAGIAFRLKAGLQRILSTLPLCRPRSNRSTGDGVPESL